MSINLSEKELQEQIEKNSDKAKELLENEDKLEKFLNRLEEKLKKIPKLGEELANVPVLISLIRAYSKKEYTAIPFTSILAILGALIYVLSPIDILPDVLPVVGLTDDAAVILLALKMIGTDVEEYKKWKEAKETEACTL